MFIEHGRVPITTNTANLEANDLIWTAGRGDPEQCSRLVKAQRIAIPQGSVIFLCERCCCMGQLAPDHFVNISWIWLNETPKILRCGECLAWVEAPLDSPHFAVPYSVWSILQPSKEAAHRAESLVNRPWHEWLAHSVLRAQHFETFSRCVITDSGLTNGIHVFHGEMFIPLVRGYDARVSSC